MTDAIALQGLHVRRYKNFRDAYVPWSDGVAIFGVNGAGKTNLLECLALLMGTGRTLHLAHDRLLRPAADDLAVDVRVDSSHLPLPPDDAFPLAGLPLNTIESIPGIHRATLDADWWRGLGALAGATFAEALGTSSLPSQLVDLLVASSEQPVIRYTLTRVDLKSEQDEHVIRTFARVLLTQVLPDWLRDVAPALPDEFAPLRTALAAGGDGSAGGWPLVVLPGPWKPPVLVEWLARARASSEAAADLAVQFDDNFPPAEEIADRLQGLEVVQAEDADAFWFLHVVAATAANEDLALTLPYLRARPVGEAAADLAFDDTRAGDVGVERTRTLQDGFLEPFSAGERRWVDEAVATAARTLTSQGGQWKWQAQVLNSVDPDDLIEDLLPVADAVADEVRSNEWFTAEAMQIMLGAVESKLLGAMRVRLAAQDVVGRTWNELTNPAVLSLRPHLTVRVFDEPEAHLHPAAQRLIASALERLRLRGNHVVITSHSPHFLALPSWGLIHAQSTSEGSTLSSLTPDDLDARKALAGQMGLTRGELLTSIGYLLVVEGEGDRMVLEQFYGDLLRDAGVGIVRMHGTDNLLATADMDFVQRYLDVPVGVLLDYTRIDVVNSSTPTRDLGSEEQQLRHLRASCRKRRRRIDEYTINRPDIVACLDADLIRDAAPQFPGWAQVLSRYRKLSIRPSFKPWLKREYAVDLEHLDKVKSLVDGMVARGSQPTPDLGVQVRMILQAADTGSWSSASPDAT